MSVQVKNKSVHIEKVILENFLSFQKDEVNFGDSSFVIIVGPNWGGKTSIFQAIKFGLGSNERDERYKKWSDFIRHGQDHAMVEIHINDGRELIQIRRTVIRGHSPFFMIKRKGDSEFKKIQATEIQKIVTDLNFNTENQFAFVSQGRIDSIKNLKATELCTFLEEGIGLKGLREEILSQKKDVFNLNKDLQSLKTTKNTLNMNLEMLRPKLERLEQKKKLLEIKKTYKDELLWANREQLKLDIKNLKVNIKRFQVEINEINQKKEENDIEIDNIQKRINEIEQKINDCSIKLGENSQKKRDLVAKVQNWQNEKIKMKQELDVLSEKVGKKEKILNNFKSQKKSLLNELKIINEEKNNIEKNIDDLIKEQSELANKIKRNKKFLEEYNQLLSEKKNKLKSIENNEKEIEIINDQINQLFQSFKDIEHKFEKNKWFLKNPNKNLLKQLDKELNDATRKIYDIEPEINQLNIDKNRKYRRLKQLQESLNQRRVVLPPNIRIIKDEIQKIPSLSNVKGPIIDYIKYDDKLSYAIESVLGENLLYSFIADSWESLNLLKRLKIKYNAYCNIYLTKKSNIIPFIKISAKGVLGYLADLIKIVGNDLDVKKVLYSKIKNCLVVDDYRSGRELYKTHNFKGKCVTLKGEQIISYKYAFETPYQKRLKGILSAGTQEEQSDLLEADLKALNDKISELRVKAAKLDQIQRDIFKKKESFHDLLYSFNQRQRLTAKKNNLYDQRTSFENNNSIIRNEINELDIKIKKLEAQKDPEFFKWNKRIKEIPLELNSQNDEKKRWDQKLSETQENMGSVEENINLHTNDINLIKLEYNTKKDSFQTADKEAFKIYQSIGFVEDKIAVIEENISEMKEERNKIQLEKNIFDKKNIQISLQLEQQNIRLNSSKQELQSKISDLERINSRIKPSKKIKIRPIEAINKDILKIDKEILRFYDVDESILVEKDQIMVTLKEITKNQGDLEKDIKAAMRTENKMEKTYYNKFKLVLNDLKSKINQKFKSSKVKFYCSLDLTGDFEELGVEIKAATSKQQLRSCTALSGGQVSMIAICLILSLQEIKPSPLCMFDEAGMFLDDKNSEIVYKLIKSTLDQNPVQMIFFLPKTSKSLFLVAEKLIGVARTGKNEVSTILEPKIRKIKD